MTCHKDVAEIPHKQRLNPVDCKECHEDSVEAVKASAHGDKAGPKAVACIGCHDVHYGKDKAVYAADFKRKHCVDCHKAYGMDTLKGHKNLYEANLHLTSLECMTCHKNDAGVHSIPPVKTKVVTCESCHNKYTILSKEKIEPVSLLAYIQKTGFINADVIKRYNYVIGATAYLHWMPS